MKKIFMVTVLLGLSLGALAKTTFQPKVIKGLIDHKPRSTQGVVFVIAKKYQSDQRMPVAVKRLQVEKFPVKFEITQNDVMIGGTDFKGPFKLTARLSPSGDAYDKSGPSGEIEGPVTPSQVKDKDEKKLLKLMLK